MGSERESELKARERKMKIPIVLFVTCVASLKAASLMESFSEEQCPAHCCESTRTQAPTTTTDPTTDTTADPTTDTTGAPTTEAPTTEAPTTPDICSTCDLDTCEQGGGG